MKKNVEIFPEATPNPKSMKFMVNEVISKESLDFTNPDETDRSPLATKLFGFPWVEGVFVGTDFITITKADWVDWDVLLDPLKNLVKEHIDEGMPVLVDATQVAPTSPINDSPEAKLIRQVINDEIRPAVAMDGGDVVFQRYEGNVVYLQMKGSCSGCPSSTQTLKMGIETRLKEVVPGIQDVVAV